MRREPMIIRRRSSFLPIAVLAALLGIGSIGVDARQASVQGWLSGVLASLLQSDPHTPVRVILRGNVTALRDAAARHGVPVLRTLDQYVVVFANAAQVATLKAEPAVETLNLDADVLPAMTVADKTVRADLVRAGATEMLGLIKYPGVTGRGVGVAVLDSGIAKHDALATKVVASVSFLPGDASTNDEYGHGTHIAGIIAGQAAPARNVTTQYNGGIAPGAHLVNLRVLGSTGLGHASNVIAGLDWVLANRTRYSIKVVNLSLGQTIAAPCLLDPLCSSLTRVALSGITVVVSAGNRGRSPNGLSLFGTVTSPGNSPFAITVGALNTWGTTSRADDTVTSYSSSGPAMFDLLIKPDVVAPGNKIVSLETRGGYLATNYSALHVAGSGTNAYSRMSGTSMAAGVVSGGVALLHEALPGLTFLHAKLLLMGTATLMPKEGLMASGAGSVDLWAARKLAGNSLTALLPTSLVGTILAKVGSLPYLDVATRLLLPVLGGTGTQQILWGDGIFNAFGQQILWGDQIMWGDTIFDSEGQQILWGDQIMWGDSTLEGEQILWGE